MYSKRVNVCGDVLEVYWDGNVWVSPSNGQQHSRARDAMRHELTVYFQACGEDVENNEELEDLLDTLE